MRRLPLALVTGLLAACGGEGRGSRSGSAVATAGPDPIVIRLPRGGGMARAYRFPALDSVIWRSAQAVPTVDRVLAFDAENGFLAFVDTGGVAAWMDLRLASVRRPATTGVGSLTSSDGWAVYGIGRRNAIVRMTPSGDWELPSAAAVRRVLPTPDGTLLAVRDDAEGHSTLLRFHPPDESTLDSVAIPRIDRATVTMVGDRVYLASGSDLLSVAPDRLTQLETHDVDDDIVSIAPTPSGDRVFLASKDSDRLQRFDRYSADISGSVRLPGVASELRMDPVGRYLLVRPTSGDSAWVVSLASEDVIGTIRTRWRSDLPAVALDGTIASVHGADVAFVDASTGKTTRTITGGSADVWFFARWNGFRPRARGIDQPVSFRISSESAAPPVVAGSTHAAPPRAVDSTRPAPIAAPAPAEPASPAPATRPRGGWTLSFAAVLSLDRARDIAGSISVDGTKPRVVTGEAGGATVYRVVMGPFDSREAAERAGRASGHSYWVYEGVP